MRAAIVAAAIIVGGLASPAAAAQAPQQSEQVRIPSELTDPEFIERLSTMTESLSRALLEMPVGEIEAAVEGRPVTESDRRRTVRDIGRLSERELQQQIEAARPKVQAAMQAFARALPAMTNALSEAANEIERATANVPQPGYPRR